MISEIDPIILYQGIVRFSWSFAILRRQAKVGLKRKSKEREWQGKFRVPSHACEAGFRTKILQGTIQIGGNIETRRERGVTTKLGARRTERCTQIRRVFRVRLGAPIGRIINDTSSIDNDTATPNNRAFLFLIFFFFCFLSLIFARMARDITNDRAEGNLDATMRILYTLSSRVIIFGTVSNE